MGRKVEVDPLTLEPVAESKTRPRSKTDRIDQLNAAIRAAEAHIYKMNLGVTGQVLIDSDTDTTEDENGQIVHLSTTDVYVCWGQRGNKKWALTVRSVLDEGEHEHEVTILEAPPEHRKLAAAKLPELISTLKANAERELSAYDQAANVALAISRGEFDDIPGGLTSDEIENHQAFVAFAKTDT